MKVVLILSGGVDSTTLLYYLVYVYLNESRRNTIRVLSFDYNQKHKKELQYASSVCKKLDIHHEIIDISNLSFLFSNSALVDLNKSIPEGNYTTENMSQTVVPNRNMIFLSIAIGYAVNINFDCVAYAPHAEDHYLYPDCRPEFVDVLRAACSLATERKVNVFAPFVNLSKWEIMRIGSILGIDYENDTWSCYKGNKNPCGKCSTCLERDAALMKAKDSNLSISQIMNKNWE